MTPLEEELKARIARDGPLTFAAYMGLALYHPIYGYYTRGERSGWRGDFITAPELDPAFGTLWARGFKELWELCGRPPNFDIVEIGPGEGGFAAAVLAALRRDDEFTPKLVYHLIERIPLLQRRQQERLREWQEVQWSGSVGELPRIAAGCVFANEVLDNLPVHVLEKRNGELLEVCVTWEDGRLRETLLPPLQADLASSFPVTTGDIVEGQRLEVAIAAIGLIERCAAAIDRGAIVLVDYGASAAELAARPNGSLMCYSGSGVDDRPLERPGAKDITAHVNWSLVAATLQRCTNEVTDVISQREVLQRLGLSELDASLRAAHLAAAAEGTGTVAVQALSRRHALRALADPGGLGRLTVIAGVKGVPLPAFLE